MDWSFINNVRLLFYCKMIKQILFILFIILLPFGVFAQTSEEQKIVNKINKFNSEISSIECDFVQTKHLQILNDKMVSYGKMYYQQPDKLRWEYILPYSYVFSINNNTVLLKKGEHLDIIDVNKNKMFKEIVRIMMSSIVGNCLNDLYTFDLHIEETEKEWNITLLPKKKEMKKMWEKLILHFDLKNKYVSQVEMYENTGDYTIIELKNVKINKSISTDIFDFN